MTDTVSVALAQSGDVVTLTGGSTVYLVTESVQGPPGPPGPQGPSGISTQLLPTSQALSGHRVVITDGQGGILLADSSNPVHIGRVVGLTTGAASASSLATVQSEGRVDEPSWNWDTTLPLYLGLNGQLTQMLPAAATFLQIVGVVLSPTAIQLQLADPITL